MESRTIAETKQRNGQDCGREGLGVVNNPCWALPSRAEFLPPRTRDDSVCDVW